MAFIADIVETARSNDFFRAVVSTGRHAQVVVMSIPVGGEIGEEVHEAVDQVIAVVDGSADAVIDGEPRPIGPGGLLHVPAGTRHNVVNRGPVDLKVYTVYAPPQHAHGTIHRTREEAEADEADRYVPVG